MSLYHIVLLLLLFGAVLEHIKKKTPKVLFAASFLVLTCMLCLRFGQGQDYFSYANIYCTTPTSIKGALASTNHSEPGWKVLCSLFRAAGASYPVFIGAISLYMMAMMLRFLRQYGGERKMLALLICYHTLFLTYLISGIRQGVVIITMLGLLLPWLEKRYYYRYCIVTALLATLHTVALTLFLFPLIKGFHLKFKHLIAIIAIGFLLGTVLSLIDIGLILNNFIYSPYLGRTTISLFAILERIVTFALVTFCYYVYLQGQEPEQNSPLFVVYKIYSIGIFLYGILMWSALISSRMIYMLKVVEVILICACIVKCKKSTLLVFLYCVLLSSVMYVKNINSYLAQGEYQNVSFIDYPYVTVFNQTDILNYRQETKNYEFK